MRPTWRRAPTSTTCVRASTPACTPARRARSDFGAGMNAALRLRDRTLDLRDEARVMGIVNVTPDSFYDRAAGLDDVVARARAIAAAGGTLVDVGGQSYAAWNPKVSADEERAR